MKLGTSQRGTLVPALVAFLVLASVGVSLAGSGTFVPQPDAEVSVGDAPRSGHRSEDGPGGDIGSTADANAEGPNTVEVQATEAACTIAIERGETALERAHGLERAIEAIVAHCARGHTQGLVNALTRLQENAGRTDAGGHGNGPNVHANEHGGGDDAEGGSTEHGRPDDPGRSTPHANEHATTSD